ncbi:MAG: nucleoside hydrolase [Christensenellales bacterium]|jgi:purine nucleosidase
MKWPELSEEKRVRLLRPRKERIDMVLDTDTYNEVDDQFALAYSLLSDKVHLQAVYAAPFHNFRSSGPEDGMVKSYAEIKRVLATMKVSHEGFAFEGSRGYLRDSETPQDSPAVRDLIRRAMARAEDDPLYVAAIGCITNVASALLIEPRILDKIVIVWTATNEFSWPTAREFNIMQDVPASKVIFDSGVPVVFVPAMGVSSHMMSTIWELRACIGGKNALCDTLCDLFEAYSDNHFGWAKEIWDIAAIAWLVDPEMAPSELLHMPWLSEDCRLSFDNNRHMCRVVRMLRRSEIFGDMFGVLSDAEAILAKRR